MVGRRVVVGIAGSRGDCQLLRERKVAKQRSSISPKPSSTSNAGGSKTGKALKNVPKLAETTSASLERRFPPPFAADHEADRTAGQLEQLRQVAVQIGNRIILAGLRIHERGPVDEVERRLTGPTAPRLIGSTAARAAGRDRRFAGGIRIASRPAGTVRRRGSRPTDVEDMKVVQLVLVDVDMAVVERDSVPVVVEIALDTRDEAVGVALDHLERPPKSTLNRASGTSRSRPRRRQRPTAWRAAIFPAVRNGLSQRMPRPPPKKPGKVAWKKLGCPSCRAWRRTNLASTNGRKASESRSGTGGSPSNGRGPERSGRYRARSRPAPVCGQETTLPEPNGRKSAQGHPAAGFRRTKRNVRS